MARKPADFKLPKVLAACADLLYTTREERLAAQKVVDALKAKETLLQDHLIQNLSKTSTEGVTGKLASVVIDTKIVPRVEDWDKFQKFILKTKNFAFYQRRLADPAVQELWEAGKEVPGVGKFNVVVVRVRKR